MGSDDFLVQVLADRARDAGRRSQRTTLFDLAIDAAIATDLDQRAWSLVTLAARLREERDHERALSILDATVGLGPSPRVLTAAFTTAAAIHCDRGDLDTARAICEEQMANGVDERLLSVAVRVYWELFKGTKLPEFKARWESCSRALEAFAPAST